MKVKCLAQEHNTMSPARARTRTARSGVERTNHEATAPPTVVLYLVVFVSTKVLSLIRPRLFKEWITLSTEKIAIQQIRVDKTNYTIPR